MTQTILRLLVAFAIIFILVKIIGKLSKSRKSGESVQVDHVSFSEEGTEPLKEAHTSKEKKAAPAFLSEAPKFKMPPTGTQLKEKYEPNRKICTIASNRKICATCEYWDGDRKVSRDKRWVDIHSKKGICVSRESARRNKESDYNHEAYGCWEKWTQL